MPQRLPHLSSLGAGSRFAARPHPSNGAGGRGPPAARRLLCPPHRSMPRLPRLRERLPLGCGIRKACGSRPRADRTELSPPAFFAHRPKLRLPASASLSGTHSCRRAARALLSALWSANRWRANRACCACWGLPIGNGSCRPVERGILLLAVWAHTFAAQGPRRARVAFFAGCIAQVSFASLHEATIRVLTANGCEVVVPEGQLCCGALAAHAGVRDVARRLARANLDVFLSEDFDAVDHQHRRLRLDAKRIRSAFPEDDPAHRQGSRLSRQDARRHRISRWAWA